MVIPCLSVSIVGEFKSDWPHVYSVRREQSEAKSGILLCSPGVYGPQSKLLPKDCRKV